MKKRSRKQRVTAMNLLMFSIAVRMRDKVCQLCGGTYGLAAHHILRKGSYAAYKFDVDNGILLCRDCHGGMNGGPHGPKGDTPFMLWLCDNKHAQFKHARANARKYRLVGAATLHMQWYDEWSSYLARHLGGGDWEDYIPPNAAKWTVKLVKDYMQAR